MKVICSNLENYLTFAQLQTNKPFMDRASDDGDKDKLFFKTYNDIFVDLHILVNHTIHQDLILIIKDLFNVNLKK